MRQNRKWHTPLMHASNDLFFSNRFGPLVLLAVVGIIGWLYLKT